MTVSEDFTSLTGRFRGELLAHCYRMLGSAEEAEDLVQETYLRAWRSFDAFEGRSSVRTWLYRIATNVCLTAIERRGRRPLPSGLGGPAEDAQAQLLTAPEVPWLQPFPDALLAGEREDPAAVTVSRTGIRLAFVAALQHLSARERAVLILRDVLEFPAAEAADLLGTTTTAVNSGLRRARAQIAEAVPAEDELAEPADPSQRALLDRFAAAFENADANALAELLREDVALEMPPLLTWFSGRRAVASFIGSRVFARFGEFRMVPVMANGQPAFAGYTRGDDGSYHAHEIVVLTVTKTGIARIVVFLNPELFAVFGLPHDYDPAATGSAPALGSHGDSREPCWSVLVSRRALRRGTTRPGRIVMSEHELAGATALVTGASRGFGRGIATALSRAGAQVVGVARDRAALDELRAELGGSFTAVLADAADPVVAGQLIDAYRPAILVLNAGATPLPRPIHHHTWQTFSSNWDTDVQQVFNFTREALLAPLAPRSTVIALSSGAALRGSPLSGGYAGAKAAVRFITSYAAEESTRAGLGIRFVSLLPQLTPATALGSVYVAAYAARQGAAATGEQGPALTPELVGQTITGLVTGPGPDQDAYVLTAAGLQPLP